MESSYNAVSLQLEEASILFMFTSLPLPMKSVMSTVRLKYASYACRVKEFQDACSFDADAANGHFRLEVLQYVRLHCKVSLQVMPPKAH